jgi:hypothetical protein
MPARPACWLSLLSVASGRGAYPNAPAANPYTVVEPIQFFAGWRGGLGWRSLARSLWLAWPPTPWHHRCRCRGRRAHCGGGCRRRPAASGSQPLLVLGRPLRPSRLLELLLLDANVRAGAAQRMLFSALEGAAFAWGLEARAPRRLGQMMAGHRWADWRWARQRRCSQVKLWLLKVRR